MGRNGVETRSRILDAAERLYLRRGYGATSIDAILDETGVTKGAFFHHFESKHALAHALIERYAAAEAAVLAESIARAERLSRDPLHQVLILVGLQEELLTTGDLPPGCLFASYAYQASLFDADVRGIVRASFESWREALEARLEAAIVRHPPRVAVEAKDLADGFLAAIEGGFVLALTFEDGAVLGRQLRQYRTYLELLFGQV